MILAMSVASFCQAHSSLRSRLQHITSGRLQEERKRKNNHIHYTTYTHIHTTHYTPHTHHNTLYTTHTPQHIIHHTHTTTHYTPHTPQHIIHHTHHICKASCFKGNFQLGGGGGGGQASSFISHTLPRIQELKKEFFLYTTSAIPHCYTDGLHTN